MNRFLGLVGSVALAAALLVPAPARAESERTSGDFAVTVLDTVERWRGGTSSPLEDALRAKLERLSASEQGGGAGGFEPPPEEAGQVNGVEDDDSQYQALQELMQKMTPLDRVKTGIWYLVIRPRTTHREELQRTVEQQVQTLSPAEQQAYQDYMGVRKSLSGASYGARIDRWDDYSKKKADSPFAELAQREVQHLKTLKKDVSTQKKAGVGRFLVKVGIVAVVLALVAVIVLGAAK